MRYTIEKSINNDYIHGYVKVKDSNDNPLIFSTQEMAVKWIEENVSDETHNYCIVPVL